MYLNDVYNDLLKACKKRKLTLWEPYRVGNKLYVEVLDRKDNMYKISLEFNEAKDLLEKFKREIMEL